MEFIATCPSGFERMLADELRSLGVTRVRPLRGQVDFGENLEHAYRACLWSRLASRVLLVVGRVEASDSDALYEGLLALPWEDHLPLGATFVIDTHGTNAQLRNTQFVALRAKDAISDRLLSRRGVRPQTDTTHPDVRFVVRLSGEKAMAAVDLAGEPLFRRGYDVRTTAEVAALRPDFAAAVLAAGDWTAVTDEASQRPLCVLWPGQGSLLAEAASIACDWAPGLLRTRWGFSRWEGHDAQAWDELLAEADERAEHLAPSSLVIAAFDDRPGAESACRQTLRSAGLAVNVSFAPVEKALDVVRDSAKELLVAADLSWLAASDLPRESKALATASAAAGRAVAAIARDETLDAALRAQPASVTQVICGRDPATIRFYEAQAEAAPVPTVNVAGQSVPVLVSASNQFAARLTKVTRLRAKWAKREDVTCYRVYDSDLPDYAVSIDLFEGSLTPGRWLQISEYAAPKGVDPELARRRLMDVLAIAPKVLNVDAKDVSLRVRTHSKGGSQYAQETHEAAEAPKTQSRAVARTSRKAALELPAGAHLVDEGGLTFEVNFDARHDCGLFLDQRETRSRIREMMKQTKGSKRFLNLFAYTGTATCYAADGGALYTTSVDLSQPSLDWAKRNMERNGFSGPEHEYLQADAIRWVNEQRHTRNRWDLIFCDVPTFSNSARMGSATFDVQRDHAELVIGISRLLTHSGVAIFSCNLRGFKPDTQTIGRAGVVLEDITSETIPEDFSRTPKVHHCYLVSRETRA